MIASVGRQSRKHVIMIIVLGGVFMAVLDGIVVSIALPTLTSDFRVDISHSQWTMTAYMLTLTCLLLFFGRVSEYTGKCFLFVTGLAVFTLKSLACSLAANLPQLICFRVLQAIGGSMVFSISGAILFLAFPEEEKGRAMGYLGSTVAVGSIFGPIIGGFLVDTLGWEYIFFINIPIGIVLIIFALVFLKIPETRSTSFTMDWVDAGTLLVSLLSLMVFLGSIAAHEVIRSGVYVAWLFFASAAGFLLWESNNRRPLLDLSVFRVKRFTINLLAMVAYFIANFLINIAGPFSFEGVLGFRPRHVGMVYLIVPAVMTFASPLSGWLFDKHHSRYYGAIAMFVMSVAFALLGFFARRYDVGTMLALFVLLGLGNALFQSPNNTEIMKALPKEKTAIASSVSATLRNLGMTLGVSSASVLLMLQLKHSGYQGSIADADPALLANVIGNILFISSSLSLLTMILLLGKREGFFRAQVTGKGTAAY